VLARPHRVRPLLESLLASQEDTELRPVFIASPGDQPEIDAVRETGAELMIVDWEPGSGDFARKHNALVRAVESDWYFVGADDLAFHPGWAEEALRVQAETEACVIGTNDLGNPTVRTGIHATHMLICRDYLKCNPVVDAPGLLFCEEYDHACCDNELVETAQWRGTYAHAHDSVVEHLHPFWGKSARDLTYDKGLARSMEDRTLYSSRRHLWTRVS
jgi:hypothetical protein